MRMTYYNSSSAVDPRSNSAVLLPGIFLVVGILLFGFSVHLALRSAKLLEDGVTTTGTVTRVERKERRDSDGDRRISYTSYVEFRSQSGEQYEVKVGGKNAQGARIKLLYDPNDPSNAVKNSTMGVWGGAIICCLVGLVFAALGGWLVRKALLRRREIQWLEQNGTTVKAEVIGVNTHERRERRHHTTASHRRYRNTTVYEVLARWSDPNSGRQHTFKSHQLNQHPGEDLIGKEVEVLVDPSNPTSYFVKLG